MAEHVPRKSAGIDGPVCSTHTNQTRPESKGGAEKGVSKRLQCQVPQHALHWGALGSRGSCPATPEGTTTRVPLRTYSQRSALALGPAPYHYDDATKLPLPRSCVHCPPYGLRSQDTFSCSPQCLCHTVLLLCHYSAITMSLLCHTAHESCQASLAFSHLSLSRMHSYNALLTASTVLTPCVTVKSPPQPTCQNKSNKEMK